MKRALLFVLFSFLLTGSALAQAAPADLDAVRAPLKLYLKGHAEGDSTYMRQAFHPDARIFSLSDGALAHRTAAEFAALFTGGPASDEGDHHRRIVSIDVVGDVAVAKIELDYPRVFLTDYMTLVQVDGGWKIISKAFTRSAPRAR